MITNEWHHAQTYDEYVDFERELISFPDDGESSVDMRVTFILDGRGAYVALAKHNNDGNTVDLLNDGEIRIDWDEALRLVGRDVADPVLALAELMWVAA